ncbi:MAG: DUF2851 family protein [Chitinophagales bacterium]
MDSIKISEDFIQFVWKFGLFKKDELLLGDGQKIQIVHVGKQNQDGGPDFFDAKIYFNDILWIGNVEIHHNWKQWYQHKHQLDANYNTVILHVCYYGEQKSVKLQNGRDLPCLVIGDLIFKQTLQSYNTLQNTKAVFIPCQALLGPRQLERMDLYMESWIIERLLRKASDIEKELDYLHGDLEMLFITLLFQYFGAPKNKDNFTLLVRSINLRLLHHQACSLRQLESFLFGMADLLEAKDTYSKRLEQEFSFVKVKYDLKPLCKRQHWNFTGMRPPSFPSIRLAQLAALLFKNLHLFSSILEVEHLKDLHHLFKIEVSAYWQKHYFFAQEASWCTKNISYPFINSLVINVVVPFLFFYAKYLDEEKYFLRALDLLREIKSEENSVIRGFRKLNFTVENALQSQALLQLKRAYCEKKNCLNCRIAFSMLSGDIT